MKDFKSGDIHGDVNINDHSSNYEHKFLVNCSNEELINEEQHRRKVLRKERSRKNSIVFKIFAISAIFLVVSAFLFYFLDEMNAVTLTIGVAGVMGTMAGLQHSNVVTSFEQRQIIALNEINALLRDRDVR